MKKLFCKLLVLLLVMSSFPMRIITVSASENKIDNISAKGKGAQDHGVEMSIDGNLDTYWQSPSPKSMNDWRRSIDYDLNGLYKISKIKINFNPGYYYHYELYSSIDGVNFNKIYQKYTNEIEKKDGSEIQFNNIQSRFIKVNVSFKSSGTDKIDFSSQDVNVAEFSIYGDLISKDKITKKKIKVENFNETSWGREYEKMKSSTKYANNKTIKEMNNLVGRVIGNQYIDKFRFKLCDELNGEDVFKISMDKDKKILIEGNDGVSLASGWNYYLKNYCKVDYNPIFESNLNMPKILPEVTTKVVKKTNYEYRYALNFCAYSYTMAFWNWEEYEPFIDWMAMNGVNMILDILGQEEVTRQLLRKYGYSDEEIKDYLVGPAYVAWFYMQNLYSYGSQLPDSWFEQRTELSRKVHDRMLSFGISPVMQGFSGQVPVNFSEKNPEAITVKPGTWGTYTYRPDMIKTYLTDEDKQSGKKNYFDIVAKDFYDIQKRLFGDITDFYAVDPFHEGGNISGTGMVIEKVYYNVQREMLESDPNAIWVMQQWQNGINESKLSGLYKKDQALVLDLQSDLRMQNAPMENQNVPWVWNMLHNFGGRMGLDGVPSIISTKIPESYNSNEFMKGIGITPEAINNSPVVYELLFDMTWQQDPINIKQWIYDYAERRYGGIDDNIKKAWDILLNTAYKYNGKYYQGASESIINARPKDVIEYVNRWGHVDINYDKQELEKAAKYFQASFDKFKSSPAFVYDYIDVFRQVLANSAQELQPIMVEKYNEKDLDGFKNISGRFINLIKTQDQLLSGSKMFLLGTWIENARTVLNDMDDWTKDSFELEARVLVSTWGTWKDSSILDYSNRQWSGLTSNYYLDRWKMWIKNRIESLQEGKVAKEWTEDEWYIHGLEWATKKSDVTGNKFDTNPSNVDLKNIGKDILNNYTIQAVSALGDETEKRINLALNRKVITNAKGENINYINDGNTGTAWSSDDETKKAIFEIDFEERCQLDGISFSLTQIAGTFPLAYKIEVYDNGKWIEIAKNMEGNITSRNDIDYSGYGEKVRFDFESTNNQKITDITELSVFGFVNEINYVNLAKNANVMTSESKPSPEDASSINDGDDNTLWVSRDGKVPAFVEVELKDAKVIDKVVLKFEKNKLDRSYQFKLKAVDENNNEIILLERNKEDLKVAQETKYVIDVKEKFKSLNKIKKVRIDIEKAWCLDTSYPGYPDGYDAWPCIAEIELLQKEDTDIVLEKNISMHKKATSSSNQIGKEAKYAVDGKLDTMWVSNGEIYPSNLSVNLNETSFVKYLNLYFEEEGRYFKFKVIGENENGERVILLDKSNETATLAKMYRIDCNQNLKSLTIDFVGKSKEDSWAWPAVAELEVFGLNGNIADKSEITSNAFNDLENIKDENLGTFSTSNKKGEKIVDLTFDEIRSVDSFEIFSNKNVLKYTFGYLDTNGNYQIIFNSENNNGSPKMKYDNKINSNNFRFVFKEDEIILNEIMLFEKNHKEEVINYINNIKEEIHSLTIGDYAGNYKKEAYDLLVSYLNDIEGTLKDIVDYDEKEHYISEINEKLQEFYLNGYVKINRDKLITIISEAQDLINILIAEDYANLSIELKKEVEIALKVLDTYKLTQKEIDLEFDKLSNSYLQTINSLDLEKQIKIIRERVQELLDVETGEYNGNYPVDAYQNFEKLMNNLFTRLEKEVDLNRKKEILNEIILGMNEFIETKIYIDFTQLDYLIKEYEGLDVKKYSYDSWLSLESKINEIKSINRNQISQKNVNKLVEEALKLKNNLKVLVKDNLIKLLDEVSTYDECNYTKDSWKDLIKYVKLAKDVLSKEKISQLDIDHAYNNLLMAKQNLINQVHLDSIKDLIDSIYKLNNNDYTKDTWNNLQNALKFALSVLDNNPNQNMVDNAYKTLLNAKNSLIKLDEQNLELEYDDLNNNQSSNAVDNTIITGVLESYWIWIFTLGGSILLVMSYYLNHNKKKE